MTDSKSVVKSDNINTKDVSDGRKTIVMNSHVLDEVKKTGSISVTAMTLVIK